MSADVPTLELDEIQGLILSGYGERPCASYVLFEVVDRAAAKRWLTELIGELQFSEFRGSPRGQPPFLHDVCANLALTYQGLEAFGAQPTALAGFSLAFQEGLSDPHRARRLGDDGESEPGRWQWGGPGQVPHGVLSVFVGEDTGDPSEWEALRAFVARHFTADQGVRIVAVLDATCLDQTQRKEHFGFRDGIANPGILGLSERASDMVHPGEVVLGYPNSYAKLPLSPELPASEDPQRLLPESSTSPARRDFGKNGSYLVFRQLEQKIQEFWEYVEQAKVGVPEAPPGQQGAIWLAAKLVGRWPNGTPLTLYPDAPGPDSEGGNDEFEFSPKARDDAFGQRCPIGSHIRRSNPRDTALPVPHDPELSGDVQDLKVADEHVALADKHRILRRGRMYGPPLTRTFEPEDLRLAPRDGVARGLHFLCFNANLARQFEFIQSNWLNNPCFAGLSRDPDPLLAADRRHPFPASEFVIQGQPARRLRGLPRVVEVRGGAYFFMPSRAALRHLGQEDPDQ